MREILFRGINEVTKKFVYGGYHKHEKRMLCPIGDELESDEIEHLIIIDAFADWNMPRDISFYKVIPDTVGQFTGLTDKNGKKIFEGDIVEFAWFNCFGGDAIHKGQVYSCNGAYWIDCTEKETDEDVYELGYTLMQDDELEIISNIHENPELLKEGEL